MDTPRSRETYTSSSVMDAGNHLELYPNPSEVNSQNKKEW